MAKSEKKERKFKIELSISCTELRDVDTISKSDPVCFLYRAGNGKAAAAANDSDDDKWSLVGRTEMISNNLNPKVKLFCS